VVFDTAEMPPRASAVLSAAGSNRYFLTILKCRFIGDRLD
jgi:hypothetical protein